MAQLPLLIWPIKNGPFEDLKRGLMDGFKECFNDLRDPLRERKKGGVKRKIPEISQ